MSSCCVDIPKVVYYYTAEADTKKENKLKTDYGAGVEVGNGKTGRQGGEGRNVI